MGGSLLRRTDVIARHRCDRGDEVMLIRHHDDSSPGALVRRAKAVNVWHDDTGLSSTHHTIATHEHDEHDEHANFHRAVESRPESGIRVNMFVSTCSFEYYVRLNMFV